MKLPTHFHALQIALPLVLTGALLTAFGVANRMSLGSQQVTAVSSSKGVLNPSLSPDQALDLKISQAGVHGIVHGTVGAASAVSLPNPDSSRSNLVATNFPFQVRASLGTGPAPFATGTTITLRIPGGTLGTQSTQAEDAPQVASGDELYVFVRDVAPYFATRWGQNTGNLLVVVNADDVFQVRGGIVHGEGTNAALAEPVAVFEQHFKH